MFVKTGELKKIMKSSLKRYGLIVGNDGTHILAYSDNWGICVEEAYASNKFKAAIMELIGDLPEPPEFYRYTYGGDKQLQQEDVLDPAEPYRQWKAAKDVGVGAPFFLFAWPHEYAVYQRGSDLEFIAAPRSLTSAISSSELDTESEHMPDHPSILGSVLYYKNETMIYWVHTESPGTKMRETFFPQLKGISFFNDDWLKKPEENADTDREAAAGDEAGEEQLPY